jgi:ABC-type xylose transport system permease subunit
MRGCILDVGEPAFRSEILGLHTAFVSADVVIPHFVLPLGCFLIYKDQYLSLVQGTPVSRSKHASESTVRRGVLVFAILAFSIFVACIGVKSAVCQYDT